MLPTLLCTRRGGRRYPAAVGKIQALVRAEQTLLNIRTNNELFIINLALVMGTRNSSTLSPPHYAPPLQFLL